MTTEILTALTIWFEARGEPLVGKVGIGKVIMERRMDIRWPDDIRDVILQPKQFSCWNGRIPSESDVPPEGTAGWDDCLIVARAALHGGLNAVYHTLDGATHYYNPEQGTPDWARYAWKTLQVGRHVFCWIDQGAKLCDYCREHPAEKGAGGLCSMCEDQKGELEQNGRRME